MEPEQNACYENNNNIRNIQYTYKYNHKQKKIDVTETQADSTTNDTNDKWVQTLYDLFTTGSHGEISGVPIILLSTVFN